jgi:hypothetical protein
MGASVGYSPEPFSAGLGMAFDGSGQHQGAHEHQGIDAVSTYFECITSCSMDDGECVTRCVEILREES